ncbi:MAG: hypothetical protein ABIR46_02940 [Candidatus Saccharimonadales bacterium]
MQTEPNAKQQIAQAIKKSTNILVTVGKDPSVDALSAALSLTLMLNRLDKHATAVFSGQTPPAITFLQPEKILENTVDSLRDFIIALDKEKADRLRYKVEDDVVRIFITPYKTIISEKDLQFSQGDFNVELIIALGVEKKEDLDTAVTAHGRILHDATVVTINNDGGKPTLGSIDWTDASASSLCEMLMSLSESLQSGLLDEQTATAILTGIVAATDRFRNEHTSPRVMTMAAQLMAAGANQQLIAAKLEEGHELPPYSMPNGSQDLREGQSQKLTEVAEPAPAEKSDGSLEIEHELTVTPATQPVTPVLTEPAEEELAKSLSYSAPVAPTLSLNDLQNDLAAAAKEVNEAFDAPGTNVLTAGIPPILAADPVLDSEPALEDLLPPQSVHEAPKIIKQKSRNWKTDSVDKPSFGGTLNATASDAEEANREEEIANRNQQVLSHGGDSSHDKPEEVSQVENSASQTTTAPPVPVFQAADPVPAPVLDKSLESTSDEALSFEPTPLEAHPVEPTLADLDEQTRGKAADEARAAVDAALGAMPFNAAGNPLESAGAMPGLDVNHDATVISQPVESPDPSPPQIVPSSPSLPPLPDFSTLPPLPGEEQFPVPAILNESVAPLIPPVDTPSNPAEYKIPGQS